jgi:hypothetical protein
LSAGVENGADLVHDRGMEKILRKIELVVAFTCSAAISSMVIAHIAFDGLSIAPATIREIALLFTGFIAGIVAVDSIRSSGKTR